MVARALVQLSLIVVFGCVWSFGQVTAPATLPPGVQEFPVILQDDVESGKTAVGTKIEARLTVATLVNHAVIPKDAIFSGTVIESVAKAGKSASRLAIRMDSVHWKDGSASIKSYLTALYYPKTVAKGPDLQYRPPEPPSKTWNGAGQYPNPDSRVYQPFPGRDSDTDTGAIPNATSTTTSGSTARMKDVALAPTSDGGIALVCERSNLKLDKLTTYVLAAAAQ